MSVADNRYLLEHHWLPHAFFEQKEVLVGALLMPESDFLYEMMKRACEEDQEAMPYQLSDYRSEAIKLSPTVYAVRIHLPQPEYVPHCYRIYGVFNEDFSQQAYFTIERGVDGDYLCAWEKEGLHVNYGVAPNGVAEELARVNKLFCTSE